VAGGDIAKAAQLALHRQEAGQSIVSNLTFLTVRRFYQALPSFTLDFASVVGLNFYRLAVKAVHFSRLAQLAQ
jgi:hypothetical protein